MKHVLFVLVLAVLMSGFAVAQDDSRFDAIPKSTSTYGTWSSDPGATWAASAIHNTKIFQTLGFDSAEVVIYVPDSMKVSNIVFYRTLNGSYFVNDSTDISAAGDTTLSASATPLIYRLSTRITKPNMGAWGFIRIYFAAAGNDTQGTEAYKVYVKRFSSVK